ncbi:MAG: sulfatase [Bacteroidetes bacterium]|nr:sulfatase [Bacteroidota bacterium]
MNSIINAFTFLVFLSFISCTGKTTSTSTEEKNSPNIIFILTDDQGWTHTSHRADPNIPESQSDYFETPNMDKLAESGVLFTQGYAPNPICSPSRNSLMFGQNGARHIYNKDADWYKKTSDWLTIPRAIKKANPDYKTAHFGKWHIAMVPKDAGFDYDDGMTSNSGGEIFGDGFLNVKDYTKAADKYMKENNIKNPSNAKRAGKPSGHWDDKNAKDIFGITSRAKQFMKESIAEGKPFYVQLSHYAAHLSLVSQKETYEYFKNKKPGERHTNPEFAAMLKDLDTGVGMILDFVKEQKIEENTYIFLMGDNGGRLSLNQIAVIDENKELVNAYYSTQHNRNLPLRDGKHSFYEGGLRVPFMAAGPGIKANRVSRTPVTGLDFLPTFTEIAGSINNFPEAIDGGSLMPLLLDEKVETVERNSEYLIFHQSSHRVPRSAIRKGDYKFIKYWSKESKYKNTPKVELFTLAEDLGETTNLIDKHPEIAKELEAKLNSFLQHVNAETGVRNIDGAYYRLINDLGVKANNGDD